MVTPSSIMDHDRNEDGEISGDVHSPPPGATRGGGPGGVQAQRVAGPGTCAFIWILGWSTLEFLS